MKDHRKPEPLCQCVTRKCMKCQEQFQSLGNRVCDDCQKQNKNLSVLGGKYIPQARKSKMVQD